MKDFAEFCDWCANAEIISWESAGIFGLNERAVELLEQVGSDANLSEITAILEMAFHLGRRAALADMSRQALSDSQQARRRAAKPVEDLVRYQERIKETA